MKLIIIFKFFFITSTTRDLVSFTQHYRVRQLVIFSTLSILYLEPLSHVKLEYSMVIWFVLKISIFYIMP